VSKWSLDQHIERTLTHFTYSLSGCGETISKKQSYMWLLSVHINIDPDTEAHIYVWSVNSLDNPHLSSVAYEDFWTYSSCSDVHCNHKPRVENKVMVVRDVRACSLTDGFQHIGRTCCLHFQGKNAIIPSWEWRKQVPPKRYNLSTNCTTSHSRRQ
jgi:hypothetical protein